METSASKATINGIIVDGKAHIQPGANNWIGIFVVSLPLSAKIQNNKEFIINYKGPFNCREECVYGSGKGKVIYSCPAETKDKIKIHVEGLEKPDLEEEVKQLKFSYNENLPIDLKCHL